MSTSFWSRLRPALTAGLLGLVVIAALAVGITEAGKKQPKPDATFNLERSVAAVDAGCVPKASAKVKIFRQGAVEKMTIEAEKLPKNTGFDVFLIQVPDAPFGAAWYLGDFKTDKNGKGSQSYVGRFSTETFVVAEGGAPVPQVDGDDDAGNNPAFDPMHTLHVGIWFNRPDDASAAGCPGTVTPFNGDHDAGIQVLKSSPVAPDNFGPLSKIG